MKKAIALLVAVVTAFTVSICASAAKSDFISSPSASGAPTLVEGSALSEGCIGKLNLISYRDRKTLDEDKKQDFEKSYGSISDAKYLGGLNSGLATIASSKNIGVGSLAVSDLFYAECKGCNDHDGHNGFKMALSSATMKNFVALMNYKDGVWSIVDGATLDANGNLTVSTKLLGAFAVVVNKDANSAPATDAANQTQSPTTGDGMAEIMLAVLLCAGAVAVSAKAISKVNG